MPVFIEILDARRSAPAAALVLHDIGPELAAIQIEARPDRAVRLDLGVVVFGNAAAKFEQLEEAANRNVDASIAAILVGVDRRRLGHD